MGTPRVGLLLSPILPMKRLRFREINVAKLVSGIVHIRTSQWQSPFIIIIIILLYLIYNVLSISAVQQRDPVKHLYIYIYVYVYIYTYIYIHTHTLFFSYYLLSCSITSDWIEFPVLYSRTSLLIHSKCNGLQLLTQTPSPSHQCPCLFTDHIISTWNVRGLWDAKENMSNR